MSHLSSSEFVDLAEGTLDPERAAHASGCDACRARLAALRASRSTLTRSDGESRIVSRLLPRLRPGSDSTNAGRAPTDSCTSLREGSYTRPMPARGPDPRLP